MTLERTTGYGPGFMGLVRKAEPLAARIVEQVRANTPDHTGRGLEAIIATNLAALVAESVEAERERCAALVAACDGDTIYHTDESGEEYADTIYDMKALAARIRENPAP